MDSLAQARNEVLVEHPQHHPHFGVEAADGQGGRNVHQVLAGQDEHAAGPSHAGLFENIAPLAVPRNEAGPAQARVRGLTFLVDGHHRQVGGLKDFQDAPAHTSQATDNDRLFHSRILLVSAPRLSISSDQHIG